MRKLIIATGAIFMASTAGANTLFAKDMAKQIDKPDVSAATTMVWPNCERGPAADRCIQYWEPGVKQAYEQWAARGSDTGMGGPEEPLDVDLKAATSADMGATAAMWGKDPSLPAMTYNEGIIEKGMKSKSTTADMSGATMDKDPSLPAMAYNLDGDLDGVGKSMRVSVNYEDDVLTAEEMQRSSAWGTNPPVSVA